MADIRTRFTVLVDGDPKELFSVREGSKGDLGIFIRYQDFVEIDGKNVAASGHRYSVHRSPSSTGFTIKHTQSFGANGYYDSAQYRSPGPDGLVALLFGRTVPILTQDKYRLKARRRDRIIQLHDSLGKGTMFYFVLVAEAGLRVALESRLQPNFASFKYFELGVLSGFLPALPLDGCETLNIATSHPRFAPDQKVEFVEGLDLTSGTFQDAIYLAESMVPHLAATHMQRTRNIVLSDGTSLPADQLDFLAEHITKFRRKPF